MLARDTIALTVPEISVRWTAHSCGSIEKLLVLSRPLYEHLQEVRSLHHVSSWPLTVDTAKRLGALARSWPGRGDSFQDTKADVSSAIFGSSKLGG